MTTAVQKNGAPGRYRELDGLRGIAATGVVLYHVITLSQAFIPPERPIPIDLTPLALGVQLFFMISGFVIFFTIRRSRNVLDFAISRFSRLYPPFWVAVAITSLVGIWSQLDWLIPTGKQFLGNLTMVPAVFGIKLIDGVYWTLYTELFFYFVMAVLLALGLIKHERLVLWLATLWAIISTAATAAYWLIGRPDGLIGAIASGLIIEYAPLFATGMLALGMRERRQFDWRIIITATSAIVAAAFMQGPSYAAMVIVPVLLFLWVTTRESVGILVSKPLQILGAVSYTWYLLHQNISYAIINEVPNRWAAMVLALLVTFVLAWGLHKTVETRVSPELKRWLRARMVRPV